MIHTGLLKCSFRGSSLTRKRPHPQHDHHQDLGVGLLQGPGAVRVVVGEAPPYGPRNSVQVYLIYKKTQPPRTLP